MTLNVRVKTQKVLRLSYKKNVSIRRAVNSHRGIVAVENLRLFNRKIQGTMFTTANGLSSMDDAIFEVKNASYRQYHLFSSND